ncbi:RNase H domain-containing protein [Trichonephila clavipes]|nr:RNase H domain-containing protein [Trichonephila clavipes]
MTSPDEIWILCDSRSAIQHLSDWTNVGDKTSVSILKNLKELSQQHEIYFQWIPSHIGLFGNDTADLLAKEGVTENLMSRRTLTFSEIFSKTKSLIQELWKTPPTHPWYNRQAPGGALSIKADRVVQTTISRLASGHIRGLSFNLGQKIYENCTKCNLVQATPDHLLFCAGLEREDIYSSPLLVCQVIYSQFGLAIHQNDHQARRRFVEWAQNEIAVVPDFHKRILFSDEAHFWLNGYVNKQNCRISSEANPQVYVETPLHPEKLTVNGDLYRAMITNFFIPELNNHDVQELWFQQDGATCHTTRVTIDLLKDTFGDRLISRFGPVNWPPRSRDLTLLDYFLWGYVTSLVYADKP